MTIDAEILEERQILARVKSGEKEAYSILVQKYMKKAYFIALGFVKSESDALDISQDAFVKAYRNIKKFKMEFRFFPWFYQILKNLSLDWLRKNKRTYTIPLEEANPSDNPGPRLEIKILVRKGVEQLPHEQREVIVLRYFMEFSYKEIASLLDKPLGTVMSTLYYAKQNLRKRMEADK